MPTSAPPPAHTRHRCFCIQHQLLGCDAPSMPYLPPAVLYRTVSGASLQSAHWVLSGAVEPSLYQSRFQRPFFCCHDQCLCTVPETCLLQPLVYFYISVTFSIRWWYNLCRGMSFHDDFPSSFSSLSFCWLRINLLGHHWGSSS